MWSHGRPETDAQRAYDAVVDFAQAVADPADLQQMNPGLQLRRLGLTLSACARSASAARGIGVLSSAPATSAPPTAVDGTDAFDTAMISLDQGYTVVVKYGGLTATGRMDPAHHAATVDFVSLEDGVDGDIALTQIGSALWMKIDLGTISRREGIEPKIWYRLALSKISDADSLPFDIEDSGDPLRVAICSAPSPTYGRRIPRT